MRQVGQVSKIQVQRGTLKVGEAPDRRYELTNLIQVVRASLSPQGVVGFTDQGERIVDVHHVDHPASRARGLENTISIGFRAHYQRMRATYGNHVGDGAAGENIIIDAEQAFMLEELAPGLLIRGRGTGQEIHLQIPGPIEPCVTFCHYVNRSAAVLPPKTLQSTLQFLRSGTRGFFGILVNPGQNPIIALDDFVYLLD